MKLNHLRDVIAVAEHGSLRAAGRKLGVAQPAITRSIREVEQELGAVLFERHARGVRLTEIGVAFLRRANSVHAELRRARMEVEQMKGRHVGEVSVTFSTASSLSLMPEVVPAFRRRFPDAVLKISESFLHSIEPELLSGVIDFYVGPVDGAAISQQFTVEELFSNRERVVVARKDHPLANARRLSELADAFWVRPLLSGSAEAEFDSLFQAEGNIPPRVALHARSALVTVLAIIHSDLLTAVPEQWLEFPLLSAQMVRLPIEDPLPGVSIAIVRRRDMPLTPLAEALCDLIRRAAQHYVERRQAALPTGRRSRA